VITCFVRGNPHEQWGPPPPLTAPLTETGVSHALGEIASERAASNATRSPLASALDRAFGRCELRVLVFGTSITYGRGCAPSGYEACSWPSQVCRISSVVCLWR
jgi:hypothetical protein